MTRRFFIAFALLLPLSVGQILHVPLPAVAADSANLDWLKNDLTCDQLTLEMKTRYSTPGGFSNFSEEKKQEVMLVLDIICGARFAHCGFKNCSQRASAKAEPSSEEKQEAKDEPIDPAQFEEKAQTLLATRLAEQNALWKHLVDEQIAKEKEKNLSWVRISVSETAPRAVQPEPEAVPAPAESPKKPGVPSKKKEEAAKKNVSAYSRGRPVSNIQADLPATPIVELSSASQPSKGGKFRSKTDPAFHRVKQSSIYPMRPKEGKDGAAS